MVKIGETAPCYTTATTCTYDATAYGTTYGGIDSLGRVTSKVVKRDPKLFETGQGEPELTTSYEYSGLKTTIKVARVGASSGSLEMSRTVDGRGHVVETRQTLSGAGARTIVTAYA